MNTSVIVPLSIRGIAGVALIFLVCTSPEDPYRDYKNVTIDICPTDSPDTQVFRGDSMQIKAGVFLNDLVDSIRIIVGDSLDTILVDPADSANVRFPIKQTGNLPVSMIAFLGNGDTLIDTGSVEIFDHIAIQTQPHNVSTVEGERAVFTVTANGYPAPSYQWLRDGTQIVGANDNRLVIDKTTQQLNGAEYRVVFYNDIERDTSEIAVLTVFAMIPKWDVLVWNENVWF